MNLKRYFTLTLFIVIVLISSMVFATVTTNFEVVEDNVCTIKINDFCEFEKKLISADIKNRQVTIQMKITNGAVLDQPTGEVMLVVDNSASMEESTSTGEKRKDLVFNSAKSLVNKILEGNENVKVGAVSFSTNTDVSLEGTIDDASLVSELTTDANTLTNAIDTIEANGPRTDLDAGITLASEHFSSAETNKYIIVLTDGVPNVAVDYNKEYYSDDVINKTKTKLQTLSAEGYNIITMLTGISNPNENATTQYTYQQIIDSIFGTEQTPTAGKFYYIQDDEIENTIVNDIYNDLIPASQSITDINIVDYFPQDIVDNFDFAYVASPNIGEISAEIDPTNNSITWTIGELAPGETAVVQYTLTLRDNYSKDIVDVILDTNERVDITYKNPDGTEDSKTSDETPKVRVTETELKGEDPTTAPTILPKTGLPVMIALGCLVLASLVVSIAKIVSINKKMK